MKTYRQDSVVLLTSGGRDEWNSREAAVESTIDARVERKIVKAIDQYAEEVVSPMQVSVAPDVALSLEDRFRVDGVEHPIVQIVELKDFTVRGRMALLT